MATACVIIFIRAITGCLIVISSVQSMKSLPRSHNAITAFNVITTDGATNSSDSVIVIGRTTQLILEGSYLSNKTEIALTDQSNVAGGVCSNRLVSLTSKIVNDWHDKHLNYLILYLTKEDSFSLNDTKSVWLCTRNLFPEFSEIGSISSSEALALHTGPWVHEGAWPLIKVQSLKFRSPHHRTRRHAAAVIDDDAAATTSANPISSRESPHSSGAFESFPIEAGKRGELDPLEDVSPPPTREPFPREPLQDAGLRTDARTLSNVPKVGGIYSDNQFEIRPTNPKALPSVMDKIVKNHVKGSVLEGVPLRNKGSKAIELISAKNNDEKHKGTKYSSAFNEPVRTTIFNKVSYFERDSPSTETETSAELSTLLGPSFNLIRDGSVNMFGKESVNRNVTRVSGIRLESHSKGLEYEDGIISLLADYEAELLLFGEGLREGIFVQFTALEGSFGGPCDVSTSKAYQIDRAEESWAMVTTDLPLMAANQERWHLCLRESLDTPAVHQGSESWLSIVTYTLPLPLWFQVIILIILLVFSGLFSGLNLGLMALDKTELEIVSNTGKPTEKRYAKAIAPIRRHGNFLLCTLLLGNVLVNSTLTILLDNLSTGLIAVIGSTTGIVIFGEIVPQAICSRHGLAIGAKTVWLVRIFMVLTGLVAWPISKLLDCVLGEELGSTYDRERLKELIRVTQDRNDIRQEEQNIICGALELHKKTVAEIMTRLEDVYMLSVDTCLDFNTISEIMQQGYSRIPIYDGERTNIISVMLIKDLAFIDPDDDTPLRTLSQFYQNPCTFVFEDTTLDVVFKEFKEGNKGHMAFIHSVNNEGDCDPFYEVLGLVTLEDVIEELIQEEIVDETDVIMDNRTRKRRKDHKRRDFKEFSQVNTHLNHRKVQISPQMQVAALQFLRTSIEPFKEGNLSEGILKKMLNQDIIHVVKPAAHDVAKENPQNAIYVQGKPVDFFVLILEGHVQVTIGRENMTFDSGPFSFFGLSALNLNSGLGESPSSSLQLTRGSIQSLEANKMVFTPDYSVRITTEVTYLKVRRQHYVAARRAYLVQQSQRDPQALDNFEKEMAKILKDESLTSPVWENSTTSEPGVTDQLLNGRAIRSRSQEEAMELMPTDSGSTVRGSMRNAKKKVGTKKDAASTPATPTGADSRSIDITGGSCDDMASLENNSNN